MSRVPYWSAVPAVGRATLGYRAPGIHGQLSPLLANVAPAPGGGFLVSRQIPGKWIRETGWLPTWEDACTWAELPWMEGPRFLESLFSDSYPWESWIPNRRTHGHPVP